MATRPTEFFFYEQAKSVLGSIIQPNGSLLQTRDAIVLWRPDQMIIRLSGTFTAPQLESMAWWMRNRG